MELDFYKNKLQEYSIEAIIPESSKDRAYMEHTLSTELGRGIIVKETKAEYIRIANDLIKRGAEGIILGCTEIPLIIKQEDLPVPAFNTTEIHARAAVQLALS
jgi:aspartate racemase